MENAEHQETIAAQATAPGRGGVAIIRLSGPAVPSIMQVLLGCSLLPRDARYLPFRDSDGEVIDIGIAIFFPHPHSFTGEDVLELHGHGGPVVVDLILQRVLQLGARLARSGEFSERAFLNGKMDLAQAEAVADLIDASSQQAARSAIRSLQGEFSNDIHSLAERLIHLRMYLEAALDFAEEEIDFLGDEKIALGLKQILEHLSLVQHKAKQGSFLREGITLVIAGQPNVGKSSLLNALSGHEIAIVTDIPGTTRDVLRNVILIDGLPVHVMDTAGLRESADVVEQEGIKRAYSEMEKADLILYLLEANKNQADAITALPSKMASHPVLFIRNKIDLTHELPSLTTVNGHDVISLSVKSGAGLSLLKDHIKKRIGFQSSAEGLYFARRRHLEALTKAESHIKNSFTQLMESHLGELAAEDLRLAHLALCEITGEFSADDLLGRIFSSFCVGK